MTANRPRIAFFGSPDFAVPTLAALLELPVTVECVITQPDRPAGRGYRLHAAPIKMFALAHQLRVITPQTLGVDPDIETYFKSPPDVTIVAAYGKIIPPSLLQKPAHGWLNVHPSLLPRWRGATPIPSAILAGDTTTGVTLMQLDAGLDTGPIIAQQEVSIRPDDTGASLTLRLAEAGAALLKEALLPFLEGHSPAKPQNEHHATTCSPLSRADGQINWQQPAATIERMVRAYQPWPGAWTKWQGTRVQLFATRVIPETGQPGQIADSRPLRVGCGSNSLEISTIRFAGGHFITGEEAFRGHPLAGTSFNSR